MTDEPWTHTVAPSCPWPERVGRRCRIVGPPPRRHGRIPYPWGGTDAAEVVVLIEGDPFPDQHDGVWSCVLYDTDLTPIGEKP